MMWCKGEGGLAESESVWLHQGIFRVLWTWRNIMYPNLYLQGHSGWGWRSSMYNYGTGVLGYSSPGWTPPLLSTACGKTQHKTEHLNSVNWTKKSQVMSQMLWTNASTLSADNEILWKLYSRHPWSFNTVSRKDMSCHSLIFVCCCCVWRRTSISKIIITTIYNLEGHSA